MSQCAIDPPAVQPAVQTPPEKPAQANGRQANGRFAKGNRGGPGNPFNRQIAGMRKLAVETVSEEQMRNIMVAMVEEAVKGNVAAARFVYQYVIGKPKEVAEPDWVDVDEWNLLEQSNIRDESANNVLVDGMPVTVAIPLADVMKDAKLKNMQKAHADNEAALAEQAALDAAEDARVEREMEEIRREYRENPEYRRQWEERRRPATLEEIMNAPPPLANGDNGRPAAAPPSANGVIGTERSSPSPSGNGVNGRPNSRGTA